MKPGIPWSVKGIDGKAREVAKDAARAQGMTLGEWLNQKILEGALDESDLKARATRNKASSSVGRKAHAAKPAAKKRETARPKADDGLAGRIDDLAAQLSQLQAEHSDAVAPEPEPEETAENLLARKLDALTDKIEGLSDERPMMRRLQRSATDSTSSLAMDRLRERMETNERQTRETLEELEGQLERIGSKVDTVANAPAAELKARDLPGFSALEGAVRNIVDHIEKSENKSRETLNALQTRIAEVSGKMAETDQAASAKPEFVAELESRMANLASQVAQVAGKTDDQKLKQIFEGRLKELAERIDAVRHSAESMGQKAAATASKAAEDQARSIETRLGSLVQQAEQKISEGGIGNQDLSQIQEEIGQLNARFDEARQQAASDQEVQALKSAIEQLSSKVEQSSGDEPIAQIEQRIADLTQQLQQVSQPEDLTPQLGQLEQRIEALDSQIASGAAAPQPQDSVLAEQMGQLEARLNATEQQLGSIGTIEDSIQQLFASLEKNQAETRELIANASPAEGSGEGTAGTGEELAALQNGLAAVKANAESADKRTQETLEAVHETLAQIIDKIGQIDRGELGTPLQTESPAAEQAPSSAADARAAQVAQGTPDVFAAMPEQPADTAAQANAAAQAAAAPSADFSPFDDPASINASALQPAPGAEPGAIAAAVQQAAGQPGAGQGDWLSVVRAHMRDQHGINYESASAAPVAPAQPAAAPGQTDFIAAARMAASANPSGASPQIPLSATLGEPPADEEDEQSRLSKLLSGNRRRSKRKSSKKDEANGSSRKRLILAAVVLLAAVSAYSLNSNLFAPKPVKSTSLQQPVITQPVQPVTTGKVDLPATTAPVELSQAPAQVQQPAPASTVTADPITTSSLNPQATSDPMLSQQPAPVGQQPVATTGQNLTPSEPLPEKIGTPQLRQAALSGDAKAQFIVASRYLEGRTVGRDHEAAARWYTRAANAGLSAAQYRIGTLYERGSGVTQDRFQAMSWYAKAAEQGNVKAMHNLAVMTADTVNGKPDMTRAAKWFSAAANHGLPDSQFNFAVLNERGLGIQKNLNEAYKWYSLAARQGDRDAHKKVAVLKTQIDPKTAAQVDKVVASWKPDPANRDANMVAITNPDWGIQQAQRQAARAPAMNAQPVETLSAKEQIKLAQTLLARKGFDSGAADGEMGSRTANAIRLYQLRNGLPVNGSVSRQLLDHLQQGTI